MCGIVGYIGTRDAYPILIKGLHRLEYRGYDSAGLALIAADNKTLNVYKSRGKVADLERFAQSKDVTGFIGIAHTRWATHGEPNDTQRYYRKLQYYPDRVGKQRIYVQKQYRYRSNCLFSRIYTTNKSCGFMHSRSIGPSSDCRSICDSCHRKR